MKKPILILQLGIVAVCAVALAQLTLNFPFPGPFIKPFLPPKLRWPNAQIEAWVEAQNYDPGFLQYFFRDPERRIPLGQNLVSPSDGVIQGTPFQSGISYFATRLSFWDVHIVRSPVAGTVKSIESEGFYFPRESSDERRKELVFLRGKEAPVQQIVTLATSYGDIRVRLITSYWASRIKIWVHPGQQVEKGERLGRILLGSNVVLELPGDMRRFLVHEGERVWAGETVILTDKDLGERGKLPD
jgi:phosphatidylserine decarboxylase